MTKLRFLMVVEDPAIANYVAQNGVDRLFVDLEVHGKQERQAHLASWKSSTTFEDLEAIRAATEGSHMLVRVNPFHESSAAEIDRIIAGGADSVMLPMFRTFEEVESFVSLVAGRAKTVGLFETLASLQTVDAVARQGLLDEAHFGLNDLHLDRGDRFMFEPLVDGVLDEACARLREAGVPFGIGGIARAGEGIVSPEYLLGEHVRLGSTAAILSRTFHRGAQSIEDLRERVDFPAEVARLREIYRQFQQCDAAELEANHRQTRDRVNDVVNLIKAREKAALDG